MKRKSPPRSRSRKYGKSARTKGHTDSIPWKYCFLTVVFGSFLVVGFLGAARQHFASIDYGFKNSGLRKEVKQLKDENRRLLLAREMAVAPDEIRKAARKLGFVDRAVLAAKIRAAETRPKDTVETANSHFASASDETPRAALPSERHRHAVATAKPIRKAAVAKQVVIVGRPAEKKAKVGLPETPSGVKETKRIRQDQVSQQDSENIRQLVRNRVVASKD